MKDVPKVEDVEYGLDDSSDEEDGKQNGRVFPPKARDEHMPPEELVNVSARYILGVTHTWLVVDEQFLFHRNSMYDLRENQRNSSRMLRKEGSVTHWETGGQAGSVTHHWECQGRRGLKCMAKAATRWQPAAGQALPQPGVVNIIIIWINISRRLFHFATRAIDLVI